MNVHKGWAFPRGIYSEVHSPITTPEIICVMALTLQPIRGCPQHSGETGTRLSSEIHRRLLSRFFLREGGRLYIGYHSTAIGWFLVTWLWLKSNVSRSWCVKQCTPLGIHYSMWSKRGGKWRNKRREKHCQFSFSWMNTTTQTRRLKLKSNDFWSYPRRETAASGGKRCR